MSYKLLCSDIDGTLLDKNRELSTATIRALKIINADIPIVLISSRMPAAMRHLQAELDILHLPLICYNGALILDYTSTNPTELFSLAISPAGTRFVSQLAQGTEVHVSLYRGEEWYVPQVDYWANREMNNTKVKATVRDLDRVVGNWERENSGPHKIMCMGPAEEIQQIETAIKAHPELDIQSYRSKATYLELAHRSISKATALDFLLHKKYPNISPEKVIAFGDNFNDLDLLQYVGKGVAVANAKAAVLEAADEITLANIEDGVALTVEKYFAI